MANEGNPDKLATLQQALDDFVEVEAGLLVDLNEAAEPLLPHRHLGIPDFARELLV